MQKFEYLFTRLTPENQEKLICLMKVMADPEIFIHFPGNGTAVILWSTNCSLDAATVATASKLLNECAARMR